MQLGVVEIWQFWEQSLSNDMQIRIKIMKLTKKEATPKIQYESLQYDMFKIYADRKANIIV